MANASIFRLLALFIVISTACMADDEPRATTSQGAMVGTYMKSSKGRTMAAFRSIPFAEPPLGELRFKAPVEAKNWDGVRDARQDAQHCIQNNPFTKQMTITGSEDCLYLNVYTPKDAVGSDSLLPVMVFFHGGGWMCGSGCNRFYGPDYLLNQDIVLVGVNYRLNVLGMFSTMDEAASGNWLLKDQNMALRWIQKHIKNFGGDPNMVTVFGESAGAASVHYHIMSPKSKGLFHRAVLHSGTSLCTWAHAHPKRTKQNAKLLGKFLKCPIYNNKKLVQCLRTKTAEEIINAANYLYDWDYDPMIPFRPVIEHKSKDSFIDEDPRVILAKGDITHVPIMIGLNQGEGAIRSAAIVNVPGLVDELFETFDLLAPITFDYQNSKNIDQITKEIKQFYFKEYSNLEELNLQNLTNLYSDAYFTAGVDESLSLQLPKSNSPIYFYHFIYRGEHSFSKVFGDPDRDYGACHVDELLYLLKIGLFPDLNDKDHEISETMVTLWTNFAKTGDPNKPDINTKMGQIPQWKPMTTPDEWSHMEISDKLQVKPDLLKERRLFWRKLPLWHKHHSNVYNKKSKNVKMEL